MKHSVFAALAVLGVGLSGCATIVQGTHESVSVNTGTVAGARCTLKNSEGTWYVTTPGSVDVHKTKNDMSVDCTKDGYADGHMVAVSHFGGTTFGNVIAGGVIGAGVDAASGANYYYDSPISMTLATKDGSGAPAASAPPAAKPTAQAAPAS